MTGFYEFNVSPATAAADLGRSRGRACRAGIVELLLPTDLRKDACFSLVSMRKGSAPATIVAMGDNKDFKLRAELVDILSDMVPDARDPIVVLSTMIDEEHLAGLTSSFGCRERGVS